ncbi:unnamed protein product [Protopolystoma xenopodis]|uniref:Uncharacterized protein n=1 Tax=Protopolystoma xenopodis TaxID=117903 RepID=A0A3S5BZX6_9PLAT|nr:unnamed protein product [Protopolystoma xenopodis]
MLPRSGDVRHLKDERLAPFHRNRRRLPRKQHQHECSSKANRRRLLVEPTFESLHATIPLEMEVSSTIVLGSSVPGPDVCVVVSMFERPVCPYRRTHNSLHGYVGAHIGIGRTHAWHRTPDRLAGHVDCTNR